MLQALSIYSKGPVFGYKKKKTDMKNESKMGDGFSKRIEERHRITFLLKYAIIKVF